MKSEKKISRLERKLSKEERKLNRLKGKGASPNYLNNYRINISELNNETNRLCAIKLESVSNDFSKIAKHNYELLQIQKIIFKPYKEEMSYAGSYANILHGKLNKNGHIYCNTKATNNWLFNPLAQYFFPSEFKGQIDCLGNVRLKTSRVGAAIFDRLPSELEGSINSDGEMILKTTKTEGDFITQGKVLISKIIGSYTFKSLENSNEFFMNSQSLLEMINQYREHLKP